ncbi:hypothetical protein ACI48J_03835 [Paenibacillus chitinolyticus]|uniref:hypothetical protein n=1 Tax=Paenibacillus chitinolyticus TaxID=79263 RepID=UPI0038677500
MKKYLKKGIFAAGVLIIGGPLCLQNIAHASDEFSGTHTLDHPNTFNLGNLKRGDIILGHNPGSNYGTYTHAMFAYQDATKSGSSYYTTVIESTNVTPDPKKSIVITDANKIRDFYNEATQLRIKNFSTSQQATLAGKAEYYRINSNGDYNIFSGLARTDGWYCSKLVWRAAYDMGVNFFGTGFVMSRDWTLLALPDTIYNSSDTYVVSTTVGNGVDGLIPTTSNDVLSKVTEEKLLRGDLELAKTNTLSTIKNELARIEENENKDFVKKQAKETLNNYINQLERIKKNHESLKYNQSVYGPSFNVESLIKEAKSIKIN